jgi:hypothetical protein
MPAIQLLREGWSCENRIDGGSGILGGEIMGVLDIPKQWLGAV